MMETVITAIVDVLPLHQQRFKPAITVGLCMLFFCLSIPCVTQVKGYNKNGKGV